MKIKTIILLIFIDFFSFVSAAKSPVQRALLIGIDVYDNTGKGGRWQNLDGCVNDALSVKEVLQARFGFAEKNIRLVQNQEATRTNVLESFNALLQESSAGDIAFIFYAGHGSQVRNSYSGENDKRDESLVPADSHKGAKDIRDKEFAAIFNKFSEKNIILTVIFDCCHSGSIGRGPLSGNPPKMRFIPPDDSYDAKDPSNPDPPEKKGVLIMSASQDFEFASEQIDANGTPHGAFSLALLQTLTTLPSYASASDIFTSVRAIIKYNGKKQEPVLAATEERKKQTLFGIVKADLPVKIMVAVIGVNEQDVTLQGGYALGIYPDCELTKTDPKGQAIRLRVKEIVNLNRCHAKIVSGRIADIRPGDLFELKSWCLPENSTLKVFVPQSEIEYEQLKLTGLLQQKLSNSKNYKIIDDPVNAAPSHTLFYEHGNWFIGMPEGRPINLGAELIEKNLIKNLPKGSSLYFSFPPTKEICLSLNERYKAATAVEPVENSSDAQYFLSGRWNNGNMEYAFVLPYISGQDTAFDMTMPTRTNYFTYKNNQQGIKELTDSLTDYSLRLAKIKAWLTLTGPPDEGTFPFSFYLMNVSANQLIATNQEVKKGDTIGLVLETDYENLSKWDGTKRFVYVFSIDCKGKMQLAFPLNGNVENRMPLTEENGQPICQMCLGPKRLFKVSEPLGVDIYIMLVTKEAIPDPGVLNQEGIRSRGINKAGKMNLFNDLLNIGCNTRGKIVTPSDWGIQKVVVKSK